jgi:hypothetical protein
MVVVVYMNGVRDGINKSSEWDIREVNQKRIHKKEPRSRVNKFRSKCAAGCDTKGIDRVDFPGPKQSAIITRVHVDIVT